MLHAKNSVIDLDSDDESAGQYEGGSRSEKENLKKRRKQLQEVPSESNQDTEGHEF